MTLMNNEIILEKEFQEKIYTNNDIKVSILNILGLDTKCSFNREIEFINGITSDFIIHDTQKIKAIIECKRADIGVTEYVRGVGQLFQYEYFQDEKISPKKYKNLEYESGINNNILIIPSDFIKNTNLNIGRFKYPDNSMIFEIHIRNNRVRQITKDELKKLKEAEDKTLVTLSQYYIRDTRIFECYILYKVLEILRLFPINFNRTDIELKVLRQIKVIDNRNWRNAFITLSSLGFITNNSMITNLGNQNALKNVYEFINLVYKDYLYTFVDLIMEVLKELADENNFVDIGNKDLANIFRQKYGNKDILFLTDSNERYVSSWMNILRDDLGCIDFKPRTSLRKINYIPKELNDKDRIEKIMHYTIAKEYVDNFEETKINIIKGVL